MVSGIRFLLGRRRKGGSGQAMLLPVTED
jgi:hypothetical protein